MADYFNEVEALINSLKNPRYATQDPPASAPILFDGELQSAFVTFCAASDDPHDYGVEVWNKAQAGEYGAIKPWTPAPPPPTLIPPVGDGAALMIDTYYYRCATQVVSNVAMGEFYYQAVEVLNASGRKLPEGPRGATIAQLAAANGMSADDLVTLLLALDDLRFAFTAARSAYHLNGSKAQFDAAMKEALETYNAASPKKIEAPQ